MTRMRSIKDGQISTASRLQRRGTILIVAMVALLILMTISAALIRSVIQSHRQMIREEQRVQTALLAEAGLYRGVAQLRSDRAYRDETWQLPAEVATGLEAATIHIIVTEANSQQTVAATAEYPAGGSNPVRITRELSLSSP